MAGSIECMTLLPTDRHFPPPVLRGRVREGDLYPRPPTRPPPRPSPPPGVPEEGENTTTPCGACYWHGTTCTLPSNVPLLVVAKLIGREFLMPKSAIADDDTNAICARIVACPKN